MNIREKYINLKETPSDINEHLVTLYRYTQDCESVCEMGVRYGVSTYAFLAAKPKKMISYDIHDFGIWRQLQEEVKEHTDFEFKIANVLDIEIDEVDLLFIDTLHNYDQLKVELEKHGNKAKKYIIFHDTTSFEWHGESYDGTRKVGIWPAIVEFLEKNPHWKIKERFNNNNGLTVLKREG